MSAAAVVRVEDAYLSLRTLAVYAGLSVRTLRAYLADPVRPLPHYRVGSRVLVRRSEFDAWVARFRVAGATLVDAMVADVLKGL